MFIKEIRLSRTEYRTVAWHTADNSETKANVKVGTVGIIRFNHYGSGLDVINQAAAIAKKDFPCLTDEKIKVVQYGGDRYRGTFGIEFNLPDMEIAPEGYRIIDKLELQK